MNHFLEGAKQYLNKIPILQQIKNMADIEQNKIWDIVGEPENILAAAMRNLLEDGHRYNLSSRKNYLQTTYANAKKKTYFVSFYDLTKDWLRSKCQDNQAYNKKLKELKLDEPYKLAIELFKEYIDFRKNATRSAQFQSGVDDSKGKYQPNIRDLFTDDDLINLGGNEFITDCYEIIGKKALAVECQLNNKPCIQNINSRTGEQLQENNPVKPDLYKRVDNHLSWQIFKDGNIQTLNKQEESVLQEAMEKEGFWKHLKKTALIALALTLVVGLPLVGIVALIHMSATGVALTAVAFMSTFATMAAYFSVPAILAFIIFTPILASMSKKSSIVDNMIKISNKNKEFNDKLKSGEEQYQQYKQKHLDFLKPEPEEGKDIQKEENITDTNINPDNTNKGTKIDPLNMVNEASHQGKNNTGKDNKENEKGNKEPK